MKGIRAVKQSTYMSVLVSRSLRVLGYTPCVSHRIAVVQSQFGDIATVLRSHHSKASFGREGKGKTLHKSTFTFSFTQATRLLLNPSLIPRATILELGQNR